jgi:predicted ATPase
MKKIVFTGGPSAGKTSLINMLKTTFKEDPTVFFAPEVASMLLGNGFPRFVKPENAVHQQRAIYKTQQEMEDLLTAQDIYKICFFDRGLMDALAYVSEPDKICADMKQTMSTYNQIFHLEVAPQFKYTTQNNKVRTESYVEALDLEARLAELWSSHPKYTFISAQQTFEEKFEDVYENHIKKIIKET